MPGKRTPTDVIGYRLKLQHLNIAMAVAQCGSMGKAAKQLAVSQPVVSKAIADLEHLLGVRLFDRARTASGLRYIAAHCSSEVPASLMMCGQVLRKSASSLIQLQVNCGLAVLSRCWRDLSPPQWSAFGKSTRVLRYALCRRIAQH
jgi:hypothetical protein